MGLWKSVKGKLRDMERERRINQVSGRLAREDYRAEKARLLRSEGKQRARMEHRVKMSEYKRSLSRKREAPFGALAGFAFGGFPQQGGIQQGKRGKRKEFDPIWGGGL